MQRADSLMNGPSSPDVAGLAARQPDLPLDAPPLPPGAPLLPARWSTSTPTARAWPTSNGYKASVSAIMRRRPSWYFHNPARLPCRRLNRTVGSASAPASVRNSRRRLCSAASGASNCFAAVSDYRWLMPIAAIDLDRIYGLLEVGLDPGQGATWLARICHVLHGFAQ